MSKYQKLNHNCTLNCGQLKIGEKNSKYFAEHKLRNFGQQKFQKKHLSQVQNRHYYYITTFQYELANVFEDLIYSLFLAQIKSHLMRKSKTKKQFFHLSISLEAIHRVC